MLFCGWCHGRGVAPVNVTVPLIIDFLLHLRRDKGFSDSAVKGYRLALNSGFALKGMDLVVSREICMLLRSIQVVSLCLGHCTHPSELDLISVQASLEFR